MGSRTVILFIVAFMINLLLSVEPKTSQSQGEIVLRLRYRDYQVKPHVNPYTVGIFDSEDFTYAAEFMGTDWDGCIYILDPVKEKLHVLKRFDRKGRFREAWQPIHCKTGVKVAVTKDGFIWTGLHFSYGDDIPGLPVVVYRKGSKRPIIDWRFQLPKNVEEAIVKVLTSKGFRWRAEDWWFFGEEFSSGLQQVVLSFYSDAISREGTGYGYANDLWILMSSDGSKVLDVRLDSVVEIPYLSSDGTLWMWKSDLDLQTGVWNRVWFWELGKKQGDPLIDRTKNREPWKGKVTLGGDDKELYPPTILRDSKGNLYLIWKRDILKKELYKKGAEAALEALIKRLTKYFYVGKKVVLKVPPLSIGGEKALVVLDRQRNLVAYLDWQQYTLELPGKTWIHPLPGGSGFYRIEYREREAVVYFHPLPR